MANILITGATGNVGLELIRFLCELAPHNKIIAGVRSIEKSKLILKEYANIDFVNFDFEAPDTYDNALEGIDRIFLLRPPHISNVEKYFRPLLEKIKQKNISEIVFLSVQGAEKSKVIPHNKIEKMIKEYGLNYIFLRPSYFMQNLTSTLLGDIQSKRRICLPAGNAKFNWIDIMNIAEVAAILLDRFEEYQDQSYEITGLENKSFYEVTELINNAISNPIEFRNLSIFRFYRIKISEKMDKGMIIVMILLHFLPRFQKEPAISDFYQRLTGKKPTDLKTFIEREKHNFEKKKWNKDMKSVLLFLANGFEEYEASVFIDVFGWSRACGTVPVNLITTGLRKEIKGTWNLTVMPELQFDLINVNDYDALAIPGGFENAGFYEDAYDERFIDLIRQFDSQGKIIASICVGALPIGKSGVLLGRNATTYNIDDQDGSRRTQLAAFGAIIGDKRIVVDDNIITSIGPSTGLDVAFLLLEKLSCKENVEAVKESMRFKSSSS